MFFRALGMPSLGIRKVHTGLREGWCKTLFVALKMLNRALGPTLALEWLKWALGMLTEWKSQESDSNSLHTCQLFVFYGLRSVSYMARCRRYAGTFTVYRIYGSDFAHQEDSFEGRMHSLTFSPCFFSFSV